MTRAPARAWSRATYHDAEGRLAAPFAAAAYAAAAPPAGMQAVLGAVARMDEPEALLGLAEAEPEFAAFALGMARSAELGCGRPVPGVAELLRLYGAPGLRDAAVLWATRDVLARLAGSAFDRARHAEQALRRAAIAKAAAEHLGYEDVREAFTAGWVQDIGVALLALLCPEHAAALEGTAALPAGERLSAERAVGGAAHPEVGAAFLARWPLTPGIVVAVGAHHEAAPRIEDRRTARLAELLRLADLVWEAAADGAAAETRWQAQAALATVRGRRALDLAGLCRASEATLPGLAALMGVEAVAASAPLQRAGGAAAGFGGRAPGRRGLADAQPRRGEGGARICESSELLVLLASALERDVRDRAVSLVLIALRPAGEGSGQAVLATAMERARGVLRDSDLIGPVEGREPLVGVVLIGCGPEEGPRVAARVWSRLVAGPGNEDGGAVGGADVTIGGASAAGDGTDVQILVEACARALEAARAAAEVVAWAHGPEPH